MDDLRWGDRVRSFSFSALHEGPVPGKLSASAAKLAQELAQGAEAPVDLWAEPPERVKKAPVDLWATNDDDDDDDDDDDEEPAGAIRKPSWVRVVAGPRANVGRGMSFVTPPIGGWLHDTFSDNVDDQTYISYPARYLGSLELARSLRSIEFEARGTVVREAMRRVRAVSTSREPVLPVVAGFLGQSRPDSRNLPLDLSISTGGILWVSSSHEQLLASHHFENVSFAMGGDDADYDLVAYVNKSSDGTRKCHVFECPQFSNQILATLGQAFLRASQRKLGDG